MTATYHHTQFATLILAVMLIAALSCAAGAFVSRIPAVRWTLVPVTLILLALTTVFSSLTVEVNDAEVTWYFGPGFWKYTLPRSEIRRVAIVRNDWTLGFGIRIAPGFRLYNVEGLDAVELRLKNGTVQRIGTDEPAALAAALK